jgi:hypothetical protein
MNMLGMDGYFKAGNAAAASACGVYTGFAHHMLSKTAPTVRPEIRNRDGFI